MKLYALPLFLFLFVSVRAQLNWQLKSDIGNYKDYGKSLHLFDFKINNPNEGFITRGDSIRFTTDGGQTWSTAQKVNLPAGGFCYTNNGNTIFSAHTKKVYKSTDGGNTFSQVFSTDSSTGFLQCNYIKDNFIIFGFEGNMLIYSTDGGATWKEKRVVFNAATVKNIKIVGPNTALVASSSKLHYTKDGCQTWTSINLEDSIPSATYIPLITGADENTWYAYYSSGSNKHLFKTTNGGNTWTNITNAWGTGMGSLQANLIYATSNGYVFAAIEDLNSKPKYRYSTDGGQTWIIDSIGAGVVGGTIKGFRQKGNILYALATSTAVNKYQIFSLDLGGSTSIDEFETDNEPTLSFVVYPNPANTHIAALTSGAITSLKLIDVSGKIILSSNSNSGNESVFDISMLPQGFYVLEVESNGKVGRKKFIKE